MRCRKRFWDHLIIGLSLGLLRSFGAQKQKLVKNWSFVVYWDLSEGEHLVMSCRSNMDGLNDPWVDFLAG